MTKENRVSLSAIISGALTGALATVPASGVIDILNTENKLKSIQQEIRQTVSPTYDRFQYQNAEIIIENFENSPEYGVVPPPPEVEEASKTVSSMENGNIIFEERANQYKDRASGNIIAGAFGTFVLGWITFCYEAERRRIARGES